MSETTTGKCDGYRIAGDEPDEFDIYFYDGEWGIAHSKMYSNHRIYVYHNGHHRAGSCRCMFTIGVWADRCHKNNCHKLVPNNIRALVWMMGLK